MAVTGAKISAFHGVDFRQARGCNPDFIGLTAEIVSAYVSNNTAASVAPNYAAERSHLAKQMGLGQQRPPPAGVSGIKC